MRILLSLCLVVLFVSLCHAAPLTQAQLQILKADILASPDLAGAAANGLHGEIAAAYNLPAVPDYWAWRTTLRKADVYGRPSPTGSVWSWPVYEGLSVAKQSTWLEIFAGSAGVTDYSLDNNRAGVAGLFGPPNVAQKDHVDAHGRRLVTRGERLYVTGTGSPAAPGKLGWEGQITADDVTNALALP